MNLTLNAIRPCLDGVIPGVVATCDPDGLPNVSYVSQIHYVDAHQVALSFQFFNKTRSNMLQNPQLTAYVIDPETTARYRLALLYLRTETAGSLFENMKAKLAGIASHTGMAGVFALRGADVCRVLNIEKVAGPECSRTLPARNWLAILRALGERIDRQIDLASLFEDLLSGLQELADIRHSMILMADETCGKLYTVATHGYAASGVGSEIPLGAGVIGVAAQYRTPIRINHMAAEYGYGNAVRASFAEVNHLETAIPFPGLAAPHAQIAIPILVAGRLLGVLYAESEQDLSFGYDEEDALAILARQMGCAMLQLQQASDLDADVSATTGNTAAVAGRPLQVRYYAANHSVFIDDDYLIKGVAGAILWRLLTCYTQEQRTDFSNRELRLDKTLQLPDIDDNLEARLILLQRRLAEKSAALAIVKTGRGRFRLQVSQRIVLLEPDNDSV